MSKKDMVILGVTLVGSAAISAVAIVTGVKYEKKLRNDKAELRADNTQLEDASKLSDEVCSDLSAEAHDDLAEVRKNFKKVYSGTRSLGAAERRLEDENAFYDSLNFYMLNKNADAASLFIKNKKNEQKVKELETKVRDLQMDKDLWETSYMCRVCR